MYVTRPLSYYQQNPDALSLPPEGPNSGYLVVQDEESETYCCFGLCKNHDLMDLPFPQNKNLTVRYETGDGEHKIILKEDVMFIPVLNKPLSSNQYYAIKPHGKSKGKAFMCSKEEDKQNCCFCRCIRDVKPKPLDPEEVYQQCEICLYVTSCSGKGRFFAKSLAPDGFPPRFLRRKAVVVGKWYCPFMFIKDGTVKERMERSMFYEMTLEQKWEQFFTCQNDYNNEGNSVLVDVVLDTKIVLIAESKAKWDESNVVEGVIWFRSYDKNGKEIPSVGLRQEIVQRMKWEQERGGWQNKGRIKQVQQYREKVSKWKKFSSYVLIERFVLRRMDKSLVMTYDFKHIDKLKSIWE
ncbi:uncharacterized protein LOC107776194 isoform X2 [Nicotiana tabacum]|uniref:Uncharacterized protein LOC107776194 isoform X2 n=3 Tax=Nicotiana TaxID=4085 RepID=A0AC58TJV4_TOBAC|nr:PREDICTED: uncharacterized protein LOC104243091 isoform X2 [Nicotiana sylvestris]XP_016451543.1 PREDICTED: uncharacterized protein LOC107776194 [Nicotiana tabacum]